MLTESSTECVRKIGFKNCPFPSGEHRKTIERFLLGVIEKASRMTRRELVRREEMHWKVVGNDHVLVL
jgi:hypothetical protein